MYSRSKARASFNVTAQALARVVRFWGLCAFVVFSFQGEASSQVAATPPKPKSVPAASVWVGGLDGGVFVLVKRCRSCGKGIFTAEIHTIAGDVWYRGQLKLNQLDGPDFDVSSKDAYGGWDGTRLFLRDDRYLARKHARVASVESKNALAESVWLKEGDSGVFVYLRQMKGSDKGVYAAQIHSKTGDLMFKGKIKSGPLDSPEVETEFADRFSHWRDNALHLRDGRILRKVE
jgi:hypothetical protein